MREGELNDKFYSHPTGRWSKLAYQILHHPVFHVFDLLLSIALMLLAVIEKPSVFGDKSSEHPLVSVCHEIIIITTSFYWVSWSPHATYKCKIGYNTKMKVVFTLLIIVVQLNNIIMRGTATCT